MSSSVRSICDVPGIRVGHAQDEIAMTGCTVVIPEHGAVAGVDVRGSAPGTREIEAIKPVRLVSEIHAVLFAGGSAFGLNAAGGVQQYLEENGVGFDVKVTTVPIVPTAVIFDLFEGDHKIRPDKQMGYQAAQNATQKHPGEGRVGAGTGATVGKVAGPQGSMNGGIGTTSEAVQGVHVGALAVVNAFGDIVDPNTSQIVAGAVDETGAFLNSERHIRRHSEDVFRADINTTLAVVATDAKLTKEEVTKIAQMAHDGVARVTRPAHTPVDGDLIICLSIGNKKSNVLTLGSMAADVVAQSILRAVRASNHVES